MVEAPKDTDQSMEDILQSIKRIIADESDTPAPASAGSDVLELTELLAEDAAPPVPDDAPAVISAYSQEGIDSLFAESVAHVAPEPEPEPETYAEPVFTAPEPVMAAAAPQADHDDEQLMSDTTLAASASALHALAQKPSIHTSHDSPVFRSGATVEDLVLESLKPMLKEWLDSNLPSLVRSLVDREIRRLGGGA